MLCREVEEGSRAAHCLSRSRPLLEVSAAASSTAIGPQISCRVRAVFAGCCRREVAILVWLGIAPVLPPGCGIQKERMTFVG